MSWREWVLLIVLLCVATPLAARTSGTKRAQVDMIVIHAIGGPECRDGKPYFAPVKGDAEEWKAFFAADPVKGIHYIIGRAGTTLASIPESETANHALGANTTSIGIELVNRGDGIDPYPAAQIDALVALIRDIRTRWSVPIDRIKRHSDVDENRQLPCGIARKVDPGPMFPYQDVLNRLNG